MGVSRPRARWRRFRWQLRSISFPWFPVQDFLLKQGEKSFHCSIVTACPYPAHRSAQAVSVQRQDELAGPELGPAIAMDDSARWSTELHGKTAISMIISPTPGSEATTEKPRHSLRPCTTVVFRGHHHPSKHDPCLLGSKRCVKSKPRPKGHDALLFRRRPGPSEDERKGERTSRSRDDRDLRPSVSEVLPATWNASRQRAARKA
jgi:hypothetical protein